MNKLGKHAKRQRTVSNAMQSEKLEHRTSTNRGTAHQHNTTRREEEITEEFLVARPENVWSCGLYTKLFWARRPESSDTLKILSE